MYSDVYKYKKLSVELGLFDRQFKDKPREDYQSEIIKLWRSIDDKEKKLLNEFWDSIRKYLEE